MVNSRPMHYAPVPPVVQRCQRGPRPTLGVELHVGGAQPDEPREQRLVQVAVLLEGRVLHHGRQLVVVANQHDALEARRARGLRRAVR